MEIKVHPETRALIFDLDGTLSDSLPLHVETWNMVGKVFGFKFDEILVYELTGRPTIEFAERIISENHLKVEPEELVILKQKAFWDYAHLLKPIEPVVAIVKKYHGILPMAVGTGASRRSAEIQLEVLKLTDYFVGIVSAEDVTKHKPEPETFLECARLMNTEPEFCQVFEDGDLGLEASRKAGMITTDVRPFIDYGGWAMS